MPKGLALYVRRISRSRHGTPKAFAKKCADNGLRWMALGGLWQEKRANGQVSSRMINGADTIKRYSDALEAKGVIPWVWGYPWLGHEARFAESMYKVARRVLIDPELGSNPTRSRKGAGKAKADAHAAFLIERLAGMDAFEEVGLSTFGSGWRMGWFPLLAFTKALIKHYGGRTFIGGQTYTDDGTIDRSTADMQKAIRAAGGEVTRPGQALLGDCEVVPNYGLYTWTKDGKRGKRRPGARAVGKTPEELRSHLYEFIDEGEPIDAMIGWAENFVNKPKIWKELARFADMMERGACRLPKGAMA